MNEPALATAQPGIATDQPPPALRAVPESVPPPPSAPRLEIPAYHLETARRLEQELGVSHVVSQVLVRRGFDSAQAAQEFLEPPGIDGPSLFDGIEATVATIRAHIGAGSQIVVHGDYDVDGVCATATLVGALRSLGANVGWFLPSRTEDGYGLSPRTIERLAVRGTRLLITVDCGITAVAEVGLAQAEGIDVVVTDHHAPLADGRLPDCPIVHPAVCGYPCAELCGTGVAFKLAQALEAATVAADIELVALATVADLVPLRGENRRLVRDGLGALANTARPGLRELMSVSRADPSALDAHALGFRLAPRINAAGRLSRPDAGLELLMTTDGERAREIAAELDALNAERRAVEQRITWEVETQISKLDERTAFVLAGEGWHPGVIGIVASRVVERYHRPTILIALDGAGPAQGSGRSIPGFDLLGALHAAADHMIRYGGHRAAAGLTIEPGRIQAFQAAVEEHAAGVLTPDLLQPVERVDAVVSGPELGLAVAEELARLEPCGLGNPRPRLLVPGARFAEVRPMGEGRHARFSVSSGGARSRAVAFGCEGKVTGGAGEPVDATFRLERNVWNGAIEPRLVLCHARPCAPAPIQVLGEPERYLTAAFAELVTELGSAEQRDPGSPEGSDPRSPRVERAVLDRRGESPLAILVDAVASGGEVLALCADVSRRLQGLRERVGGFALVSHHGLDAQPDLLTGYRHIVVLDPPCTASGNARLRAGSGFTHLAWGQAELRFAEQMHELEYGLRASLVTLYRSLRHRERVVGEELERLLRGDGPHGRPARLAGRLIRVLAELELVSLDRDLPALAIGGSTQTALESSAAYRAYTQRYEDGRQFLSSANLQLSG